MQCNHCQTKEIKIITKASGLEIYHCLKCGYNFSEEEISKKITVARELPPGQKPVEYKNRVDSNTIVQAALEVTNAVVSSLF